MHWWHFEILRQKVLADKEMSVSDILMEAKTLIDQNKHYQLDNLKSVFDNQSTLGKKMQSLLDLQKGVYRAPSFQEFMEYSQIDSRRSTTAHT